MDRAPPGEGLPAPHDNIDIGRADLEATADATGHFGRDQARARHARHQRAFADDGSARLNERHQHVEGTAAKLDRPAVDEELAAMRQHPEAIKRDARRRFGRRFHRPLL